MFTALARAQPVGNEHDSDALTNLAMLRDPTGNLDIVAVMAAAHAPAFQPVPSELALGYTTDTLWLRFTIQPDATASEKLLEVWPPVLDEITLYSPQANGGYAAEREGNLYPSSTRIVPHPSFVFPLGSARECVRTYYLRIHSRSSLQLRLRLWHAAGLIQASSLFGTLYGMYFGMVVLVIAFNLIFWLWLRDPLHLAYSGYLLVNSLSFAFMSGYAEAFVPDIPGLADRTQKAMVLLQLASMGFFFGWLFQFRRHLPRFHQVNKLLAWGLVAYAVLVESGLIAYAGRFAVGIALPQIAAVECLSLWLVIRGQRELAYYWIAFTAFLLSAMLVIMHALGWLPSNASIVYLPLLASAVHMVLINVGMAQRAQMAERERRDADLATIHTSLQNERELEQRVIQRTQALEQANAALQREVSERTELQVQLHAALAKEREAMATQRQFVAMVSHEFRTPLAIIDATAQRILLQHATESAVLAAPMHKIRRGVQRLNDLIDTFLGEERLPTQGQAVVREPLDLHALAMKCVEQHLPLSTGLIHCPAPELVLWVDGDAALLTLVLSNLVDNALKYSPPGSPVTLQIGSNAVRGWIDVIDYGVGIPAGDRERVFEKHVRLDAVSGVGGSGLGLHIARNAARRMGGDIELDSEPGRGSTFRLSLPRAANHP